MVPPDMVICPGMLFAIVRLPLIIIFPARVRVDATPLFESMITLPNALLIIVIVCALGTKTTVLVPGSRSPKDHVIAFRNRRVPVSLSVPFVFKMLSAGASTCCAGMVSCHGLICVPCDH